MCPQPEWNDEQPVCLEEGSRVKIGKIWVDIVKIEAKIEKGKTFYEESVKSLRIEGAHIIKE